MTLSPTTKKTIFCDIDGTLLTHAGGIEPLLATLNEKTYILPPNILPGVREKLQEWEDKGYNIILTTGRRESLREATEKQLFKLGISYDQLVMGIGGGQRILINDLKTDCDEPMAVAINLVRNKGMEDIEI